MGWLSDVATFFNDTLGFGAIDKVQRDLFGFSGIPSAFGYSGYKSNDNNWLGFPSSSGGTSDNTNNEMAYNAAEAQKTRDWQEHMRDTSLTSAFNQARENGLNPYVMLGTSGASTPGASAASYSGYAASERSAQQSGLNALISAMTALSVAKTPKTTVVVK